MHFKEFILKNQKSLILLVFITSVLFLTFVTMYFSLDRYNNFVYGKFDLGNMNQMLYNSSRGHFMLITDYFGDNTPRWSMSHVDPSLLIFIPISLLYSDASILLYAQTFTFTLSAFLVYLIARKENLPVLHSAILGLLIFLMPISGYILIWTTFHSLVLAIPSLLLVYYLLQHYPKKDTNINILKKPISKQKIILSLIYFSVLMILTSKEELGIVLACFLPFLYKNFKERVNLKRHFIIIGIVSVVWSLFCFFYLIPSFSSTRSSSLNSFVEYVGIENTEKFENIDSENYFLYRYQQFGDSYTEIAQTILFKPWLVLPVVFNKDTLSTLNNLLMPTGYSIFATPYLLIAALPEISIHMLSGTADVFSITNHRLAINIPILVLSALFLTKRLYKKKVIYSTYFLLSLVFLNIFFAFTTKNPLLYPLFDRVTKKIVFYTIPAFADNSKSKPEFYSTIRKECADYVVAYLKDYQKVSVPQPLGAKTSNKYYNALFPAGMDEANVVVTDIYARKLVDFLDVDTEYNKKAVKNFVQLNPVTINLACDRFAVLEKRSVKNVSSAFSYNNDSIGSLVTYNAPVPNSYVKLLEYSKFYSFEFINLADDKVEFDYVYSIGDEEYRKSLFSYTVITNGSQDWTFLHFPSTYMYELNDWPVDTVLKESIKLKVPKFLPSGKYSVYFGLGNRENNERNIKVGEITL